MARWLGRKGAVVGVKVGKRGMQDEERETGEGFSNVGLRWRWKYTRLVKRVAECCG